MLTKINIPIADCKWNPHSRLERNDKMGKITKGEFSSGLKAELESKAKQSDLSVVSSDLGTHLADVASELIKKVNNSEKGEPNGVATLDGGGKLLTEQVSILPFVAGEGVNIITHLDQIQRFSDPNPKSMWQCQLENKGSVRVSFDLSSSSSTNPVYARVYKNGTPVGIQRSRASNPIITYVEDFEVVEGDILQIYGWGESSIYIRNVKISVVFGVAEL